MDKEEKLEIIMKFIELLNDTNVQIWDKVTGFLHYDAEDSDTDTLSTEVLRIIEGKR